MVRRIRALEKSMLNTLGALLPICASCKKIRESNGQWTAVNAYIADHSDSDFSHGICPECARSLYPGIHGIPLYDADLEAREGIPAPVADLKERIAAADGLLIVTPATSPTKKPGVR